MNTLSLQDHHKRTVYGAYYDEARIVRLNVGSVLDGVLSQGYDEGVHVLQAKTGLYFYLSDINKEVYMIDKLLVSYTSYGRKMQKKNLLFHFW